MRSLVRLALSLVVALPAWARGPKDSQGRSSITLDGRRTVVRWVDGDTFKVLEGPLRDRNARLDGYNTLETYGPVHQWGSWRRDELLEIARSATTRASAGAWTCTLLPRGGGYGRLLVSCPDAAAVLVRSGLAMVFAIDRPGDPVLLAAQREAQRTRAGMWAGGIPSHLVTSVHSAGEARGGGYNRLADTASGEARPRVHGRTYAACEEVCEGVGRDRSCMVYVPFERMHRNRPHCLSSPREERRTQR